MIIFFIAICIIIAGATIYFAIKSREFRKFLAGAFFVSGGIQLYLYIVETSVRLTGTSFVQTPELSLVRSILHFIFFLLCFYFGFMKKPKKLNSNS
jgi:hypothetical protein